MKKTKGQLLCILGEFAAMFVVPLILLWAEYGSDAFVAVKYKISISGVLFTVFFFMISRRFWLDEMLKKMHARMVNIETDALSVVDPTAIENLKKVYKRYCYIDLFFKAIVPLLLLAGITLIVKALEEQALKMYGVFLWSSVSFAAGIILKIVEISLTRTVNEKRGGEKQ